jgi:hypothetical protein
MLSPARGLGQNPLRSVRGTESAELRVVNIDTFFGEPIDSPTYADVYAKTSEPLGLTQRQNLSADVSAGL